MPQRLVASTSMVHAMPVPVGRTSVRITALAVPGPALLTVMPNPMGVPALTLAASAVFTMERSGQSTVVLALALTSPALVAVRLAVLGYSAHEANVVGLVTWT